MPNNYFRFKQFIVRQEHCAMKVCTDACLFGSSLPLAPSGGGGDWKVLDIGTGTGLLSLMYAQKNPDAIIDAVEIDEAATIQARQNFEASPWRDRLHVYHSSIQQFLLHNVAVNLSTNQPINAPTSQQYDLIFSNPPFFENDLKSSDAKRNLALHSAELSLEELLNAVTRLLKDDGSFAVLLPYHRSIYFEALAAAQHFYLAEKILVKQTPGHNFFRSILLFEKTGTASIHKEIVIQNEQQQYTAAFIDLLKDYYLYL